MENDRVRVLEFRGKAGDRTEMHSHPAVVAIGLTDGEYRFSSPGGPSMEIEMKAGDVVYMDAMEHATEVLGTGEARGFLVELK